MSSEPGRRTRVTLRCLREDLEVEVPAVEVDLDSLDHPLVGEARVVAPAARRGQRRILSIGADRPSTGCATDGGLAWLGGRGRAVLAPCRALLRCFYGFAVFAWGRRAPSSSSSAPG